MLVKLRRIAWSGLLNFFRTPLVASASIVTLTATLFVFGALVLSNAFFTSALVDVQGKVDISVSFKPDVVESRVTEIKKSLELLPEIKEVTYSSREQELSDFRSRNADNDLIIQSLSEVGNPFGARLNIRAVEPGRYETIANFLQTDSALTPGGETIIDQVIFKKDVVDKLLHLLSASKKLAFAITLVLIFISLLVTFNTIALAIYSSREEISLMQLVGASRNYIRGPFLFEGIISGVIASLLSLALLYPAVIWIRNQTAGIYGGVDLVTYFGQHFASLFGLLLLSGIILGALSSFMATWRFLKT